MKNLFKKDQCGLCGKKELAKDMWQLQMNTADGEHLIKICTDCSNILDSARDNLNTWAGVKK